MQGAWTTSAHASSTATPRTPPSGMPRLSPSGNSMSSPITVRLTEEPGSRKRPPSVQSPACAVRAAELTPASLARVEVNGNSRLDSLHELLVRETRERADGQQQLTLRFQQQQASIAQLAMQLDTVLADRRSATSVGQRSIEDSHHGGETIYSPGINSSHRLLDPVDPTLLAQGTGVESRLELMSSEIERTNVAIAEVRRSLVTLEHRVASAVDSQEDNSALDTTVEERLPGGSCGELDGTTRSGESEQDGLDESALDRLIEARLESVRAEGANQASELEARLKDEWMALRGWVDAAVVAVINRISSLEYQVQTSRRADEDNAEGCSDHAGADSESIGRSPRLLHRRPRNLAPEDERLTPASSQVPPQRSLQVLPAPCLSRSESPASLLRARSGVTPDGVSSDGLEEPLANGNVDPVLLSRRKLNDSSREFIGELPTASPLAPSPVTPLLGSAQGLASAPAVLLPASPGMPQTWTAQPTAVGYSPRPGSSVAMPAWSYDPSSLTGSIGRQPTFVPQNSVQVVTTCRGPRETTTAVRAAPTAAFPAAVVRSSSAGGIPSLSPPRASLTTCPGTPGVVPQVRHISAS